MYSLYSVCMYITFFIFLAISVSADFWLSFDAIARQIASLEAKIDPALVKTDETDYETKVRGELGAFTTNALESLKELKGRSRNNKEQLCHDLLHVLWAKAVEEKRIRTAFSETTDESIKQVLLGANRIIEDVYKFDGFFNNRCKIRLQVHNLTTSPLPEDPLERLERAPVVEKEISPVITSHPASSDGNIGSYDPFGWVPGLLNTKVRGLQWS